MRTWIDRRNINRAARLKEDGIAGIAQSGYERETFGLGKRFSSRDLHEAAPVGVHLRQDVIDRAVVASIKGIVGIAPGAAKRASSQSNKYTGLSGIT